MGGRGATFGHCFWVYVVTDAFYRVRLLVGVARCIGFGCRHSFEGTLHDGVSLHGAELIGLSRGSLPMRWPRWHLYRLLGVFPLGCSVEHRHSSCVDNVGVNRAQTADDLHTATASSEKTGLPTQSKSWVPSRLRKDGGPVVTQKCGVLILARVPLCLFSVCFARSSSIVVFFAI